MDSFEDLVCLRVSAAPRPPSFDDASVVPVDFEPRALRDSHKNESDKKFHSDSFGPTDVSPIDIPPWFEGPGAPPAMDHDSDPNT